MPVSLTTVQRTTKTTTVTTTVATMTTTTTVATQIMGYIPPGSSTSGTGAAAELGVELEVLRQAGADPLTRPTAVCIIRVNDLEKFMALGHDWAGARFRDLQNPLAVDHVNVMNLMVNDAQRTAFMSGNDQDLGQHTPLRSFPCSVTESGIFAISMEIDQTIISSVHQ